MSSRNLQQRLGKGDRRCLVNFNSKFYRCCLHVLGVLASDFNNQKMTKLKKAINDDRWGVRDIRCSRKS